MHNPEHEFIDCIPADAESVQSEGSAVEGGRASVRTGSPAGISHQQANDSETEDNESDDESDTESDVKSGSEK
jgi:hypothetical protein